MSSVDAQQIAEKLLEVMGVAAVITIESDEPIYLNISSDDSALLIGKRGDNLRALQTLINTIYHHQNPEERGYVGIDIAGYKKERVEKVQASAQEVVEKVRQTGEPEHLRPMNAFERRAVHTQLANESDIVTESEGEGINRHIVIKKL